MKHTKSDPRTINNTTNTKMQNRQVYYNESQYNQRHNNMQTKKTTNSTHSTIYATPELSQHILTIR